MEKNKKFSRGFSAIFSAIVIPIAFVCAVLVFKFVMGNPMNFQGGNPEGNPLPGNYLATIYKGGFIVPLLMTLLITVFAFTIERFISISRAAGKGHVGKFVHEIKLALDAHKIDEAKALCDKQKGAVANVVKAGLFRYQDVEKDTEMSKDQKIAAIQKEIEEATSLEMPTLQANLVILATITSLATLIGLLGTVMGMIRAFAAIATAGAPDSVALATGISEALINTAFGIGSAACAMIFYNVFTSKIDKLTYAIDETGFSISQAYAANHK